VPSPSDQAGDARDEARIAEWVAALERRHLASLRFSEVSRALRALSSAYVERRSQLARGAALDGGGKRAAFALTYGPLHLITVREILRTLPRPEHPIDTIVDLGCGTGAAGSAWALALEGRARVVGIDRHQWAVSEASWTYHHFGLRARAFQGDVIRAPLPTRRTAIVAGWLANELSDDARQALLARMLTQRHKGATLLIVEPIARSIAPWWDAWADTFASYGGRSHEWRFSPPLPEIVQRLDRAAGLSHTEVTARSLYLAPDRRML
jgi:SAM-dependent methyltransferase